MLFNSTSQDLAVELFADTSETIDAAEVWKKIEKKFTDTSGELKQAANVEFLNFSYSTSLTAQQNILRFKKIVHKMKLLGSVIDEDFQCTRLLASLPPSWDSLCQEWQARADA